MFSDILLTVDFDRTLTDPDSSIPARNIEAIRYFIANGGAFTLNTGRSLPQALPVLEGLPLNAPVLMYNGGAAYDRETGQISDLQLIDLDAWETVDALMAQFPDLVLEMQGLDAHYNFAPHPMWDAFCERNGCPHATAQRRQALGPLIKLALYHPFQDWRYSALYDVTPEELARMDEAQATLTRWLAGKAAVFRPAPKAIDIHPLGVSKATAARALQKKLGRKILVCVGDAENDISMLRGADHGFCPADGAVADQFPNVCPCGEGAVADVIYEKIPEILKINA